MDDNLRRLGQHAKQLLSDPTTQEVLLMIEQQLTREWQQATDTQKREDVWYTLLGHRTFVETLAALESNYTYELQQEETK